MLLAEPPRTQYDLHFQVAGVPVRVHPLFWLMGVILGAGGGGDNVGARVLIWVAVIFISILIHELGHAFTMRRFGESPRVVLYMMGGLAVSDGGSIFASQKSGQRSTMEQILISAAGPGAGFVFAILVAAVIYGLQGRIIFYQTDFGLPGFFAFFPEGNVNEFLWNALNSLLYVNIFWGLMNLLPVYPLDGGQIAQQLFVAHDSWNGTLRSLWLSVIVGGAIAFIGFAVAKEPFIGILFGSLAISSYMMIQQIQGGGGFGGGYGGGGSWGGGRGW